MEAATPLRQPRITVLANRVLVDGLAVDDPPAADLVRSREEAGDDPARIVADATELVARPRTHHARSECAARVLPRGQAAGQLDAASAGLESPARQLDAEFVERAR